VRLLSGDARRAVFAPLDDGVVRSEVVVRRLASAIALGLVVEGEQLPNEADLATSLNVSTFTLRDALAELRERGLVVTRRGRSGGTFVCAADDALDDLSQARLRQLSTTELRELGDHRSAISGAAAQLAAARASETEIRRLQDIVDRLGAAERTRDRWRLQARFYVELAAAAQSVRLTLEEIELQGEAGQMPWPAEGSTERVDRLLTGHRQVVEAVADRDGGLARSKVEESLAVQTEWLVERHLELAFQEGRAARRPQSPRRRPAKTRRGTRQEAVR
jgi:DNA-binding FadR family transcriptional regulator